MNEFAVQQMQPVEASRLEREPHYRQTGCGLIGTLSSLTWAGGRVGVTSIHSIVHRYCAAAGLFKYLTASRTKLG